MASFDIELQMSNQMSGISFFQRTPEAWATSMDICLIAFTSAAVAPFLTAPRKCQSIWRGVSDAISAAIIAKEVSTWDNISGNE